MVKIIIFLYILEIYILNYTKYFREKRKDLVYFAFQLFLGFEFIIIFKFCLENKRMIKSLMDQQ